LNALDVAELAFKEKEDFEVHFRAGQSKSQNSNINDWLPFVHEIQSNLSIGIVSKNHIVLVTGTYVSFFCLCKLLCCEENVFLLESPIIICGVITGQYEDA
jgi:DNA-binding transcriptional MocR family regulator